MTDNTYPNMTDNTYPTDRRSYLKLTGGAAAFGLSGLAGCLGSAGSGTLATSVTDQPEDIGDFESCLVTIDGIWLGPEDAEDGSEEDEEPSGREYHAFDEPQEADLVQLQDESTQLVDERDLDVASYEFLQLDVTDIDGTLENGDAAEMETPGEAPLTFNEPFEIREDTRTSFTADFAPVRQGETERYVLRPVPEGISVDYDERDDEE